MRLFALLPAEFLALDERDLILAATDERTRMRSVVGKGGNRGRKLKRKRKRMREIAGERTVLLLVQETAYADSQAAPVQQVEVS